MSVTADMWVPELWIRIIFRSWIWIRFGVKSWVRIRIKVKIKKLSRLTIKPWRDVDAHN
jgi:hypothetical protein